MTYVSKERTPLVLEWNAAPIVLGPHFEEVLTAIGATPPDIYGNGKDQRVTPCKVTTKIGQIFDPALICIQLDAPVQDYMQFRLGSEIGEIDESEFALPWDVRIASAQAMEMRMGFSPSLIQMPDGKKFVLNGRTSFLTEEGYRASDARRTEGSYFAEDPPPAFIQTPTVTFFIVDGDPGWVS
jgi:hypothetical protein